MAEANSDNQVCSGSGARSPEVEAEATRLAHGIIEVITATENVWKTVSEKQSIVHRLYAEQITVSDKFSEYYEVWWERDHSLSDNIASFHSFTEIDEQAQLLAHKMHQLEERLAHSGRIVRDLIRDVREHMSLLRQSLEKVVAARRLEELEHFHIPNLDWIQSVPDPEIEKLAEEWEASQLEAGISVCLHQLQLLAHSSS